MKETSKRTSKRVKVPARMMLVAFFLGTLLVGQLPAAMPAGEPTRSEAWFPGLPPGEARTATRDGGFILENDVLGAHWQMEGSGLRPATLVNKLTQTTFDQTGTELFRLGLKPNGEPQTGYRVAVRLEPDKVVALASKDGRAWSELGTFSRGDFPGEPRLVRLGKMDLRAQAKDYTGPAGALGQGSISELEPLPASLPAGRFDFKAAANHAATTEYAFPPGTRMISCRIDKGTDQGMSWSPALALVWEEGQRFLLVGVRETKGVFNLTTASGEKLIEAGFANYPVLDLAASVFRLDGKPKFVRLAPRPDGGRVAERKGGWALAADLVSETGLRAHWQAELRDDSSYVRQTVELSSPAKAIALYGVELADVRVPGARTIGTVAGCPVAGGGMFFGVEMPGTQNAVDGTGARLGFACKLEVSPAQSYGFGAVAGVAPEGQLRRAFLFYLERERARPSRPFLHYNCWYDLGFSADAEKMLDVVRQFSQELVKQRGVPVRSYLVDDGWDTPGRGLWTENLRKYPGGLAALNQEMKKLDAHLAIWISPLGGYGGQAERTAEARKMGLIPEQGQLDLAYPGYKNWFQERCLQLMREDGVNAFKWDKAGEGVSPHFMALLDVARTLRRENPELFINVTVGTWPSPFWLNHVDSTWRNGSGDVGWAGKGDDREKWLTFRDGNCRRMFVEKSPLYPLNSVMHHGVVHGRCFQGERVGKSGPQLKNEVRSYFANGAMLQELYVTPSMMTPESWDALAEAARWAQANADVLVDAHWVGGDPLKLEPYGYAAWAPRKGTLMVRNPDDQPRSILLDAQTVFELPAGTPKQYTLVSAYKDQRVQSFTLEAGKAQELRLEPFEVLVFETVTAEKPIQSGRGHPFVCTDYTQGKVFIVSREGKVEWEYPAATCNDVWVLPNGNLLFNTGHGVREVTREKKVVFDYQSQSEIYACQRLTNGNTFIGECSAGRLLEVDPAGKVVKEVRLLPAGKDGGHSFMRNARKLENGNYLVAHYGLKVVREYGPEGKLVREIPAEGGPHSAVRLPNGNTLIACADGKGGSKVFEVDPKGKTVWQVQGDELPGISLKFMAGLQRLPNGNTVMANWLGHNQFGTAPHLIEVTPDKQVVWTFSDHQTMRTISSVQLLDVPGDVTRGEILH